MRSVFDDHLYPFRYAIDLSIPQLAGGVPANPDAARQHIERKLQSNDQLLRTAVAELMLEKGITADEAAQEVRNQNHVVTFRRDPERGLWIGGYQLKAAVKEAASVARAVGRLPARWGLTRKGIEGFVSEHIFVCEDRLYLGVDEPSGSVQRFVQTWRGSGISIQEYVEDAKLSATIETDHEFSEEEWAILWTTGERQGVGATRSQGFGRYYVTRWERLP